MVTKLYAIKVSGPLRIRWMRIKAPSEGIARMKAFHLIWPRKGEYIQEVKEVT